MIVDTDAHWTPRLEAKPTMIEDWMANYLSRTVGTYSQAESRILELKKLKVDRQVLNPMGFRLGLNYAIPPILCPDIMRVYNDFMLDLCHEFSEFDTNLWVSLQNIDAAVDEIQSRLDQNFFGIYASDGVAHGFRSDLEPLWYLLDQNKIPFYMHFRGTPDGILETKDFDAEILCPDPKWQKIYAGLGSKFNNEKWMMSTASLIMGGVFDRHTDLRIIIAERDIDWIGPFCRAIVELGHDDPLPVFKNNFWFTTDPESVDFLVHADNIGWNRLLFATDWPHTFDKGGANSLYDVDTVLGLPIDHSIKQMIFFDNYSQLKR